MAGNTLSNGHHGEPLDFHVYELPARMAIAGAMDGANRTVVEYGGNTPMSMPPAAMPPSRVVPAGERMSRQDAGRPPYPPRTAIF